MLQPTSRRTIPHYIPLLSWSLALIPVGVSHAAESPADEISDYFRVMWGLFIVVAIILILYALFKKRFSIINPRSSRSIRVLEIQPLMPRKSLCLVEVKGREFLLGVGNDTITLLASLDDSPKTSFQETLDTTARARQQP